MYAYRETLFMMYLESRGVHWLGMGELRQVTAAAVYRRFKEATGTRTLAELSVWLETKPEWIRDAKKREIVPVVWLGRLLLKQSDYTPHWVLTGRGPKRWEPMSEEKGEREHE